MPSRLVPGNTPKHKSPPRTASTPPLFVRTESPSSSAAEPVDSFHVSVLGVDTSNDGDQVEVRFSDRGFTFFAWWLYLSRHDEGLPSPDGAFCKTPSRIHVGRVGVTGAGIWATVDITWNTGTTSQFPALWLRVLGPTNALERGWLEPRLPVPGGKDPGSGVGQLTWGEKRVRVEYRGMLIDTMKGYMEEEWLLEVPTPLLREMVEYVEVDIQSKNVAASLPVAEASRNDTAGHSSDEDSLIDEEVDE